MLELANASQTALMFDVEQERMRMSSELSCKSDEMGRLRGELTSLLDEMRALKSMAAGGSNVV
mgnify:CR=1 FL=1